MRRLVVAAALAFPAPAPAAVPEPPAPVKRALQQAFGESREYRVARCVAWHESRFDPRAVSRTADFGLLQINRAAHRGWVDFGPRILTVAYNVRVARRIYDDARRQHGWQGRWAPWVAYSKCRNVR